MRTTHNLKFSDKLKEPHRTIYEVGTANGLRVSDVISLKKNCLKVGKPTIREQKTGKSKRLYLPVKTRKKLEQLAKQSPNDYIFFSKSSKTGHISRQAVFKAFKKAAKESGIEVNIATHTMRKNYAYKYFGKCKNLQKLQKKLNHSNASETALYLI